MAKSKHKRNQTFKKKQQLWKLLFAYDQVIIADTEDDLQKTEHKLNEIITEYVLITSAQRTMYNCFLMLTIPMCLYICIKYNVSVKQNSFMT